MTTSRRLAKPQIDREARVTIIARHVQEILEVMDEPPREGLEGTPERVARMYIDELFHQNGSLKEVLDTMFLEKTSVREAITLDHIPFRSWCEHHMLPYFGVAHVAYIPTAHLIGLSKIARLVEAAGQGLTIQERVTDLIADAMMSKLNPLGTIVVVQAVHTCMVARGVRAHGTMTTTTAVRGIYKEDDKARAEFFSTLQLNGRH